VQSVQLAGRGLGLGPLLQETNQPRATASQPVLASSRDHPATLKEENPCRRPAETSLARGIRQSCYNAHGQVVSQSSNGSSQALTYDNNGRLVSAADTDNTINPVACTTRTYAFDADSNRTSLTSYPAGASGVCSTSTIPTVTSHSYDEADRIAVSQGYAYDPLGRTTTVPAADAGGATLTNGYYLNDMVASQGQGTATKAFGLDPSVRVATLTTGSTVQTDYYANGSDSPAWIGMSDQSWTRNVEGIDGNLAAIVSSAGSDELQLTNLHGDVVATAPNSSTANGTDSYIESTEFGIPRASNTATPRYAWLGGKRRDSGDALAGIVLMGARLYDPTIGRFLQVDPQPGGSANNYDYVNQDPLNKDDLNGQCPWCIVGAVVGAVAGGGLYWWQHRHEKNILKNMWSRPGFWAYVGGGALTGATLGVAADAEGAASIGAWAFRARGIGAQSRLFGDIYSGARSPGLLNRGANWAIGWSGKRVVVNGVRLARTVFRIKTPWISKIDLLDGPFR